MTRCISEEVRPAQRRRPIKRALRESGERALNGSYTFVASPLFTRRGVEARLIDGDAEPRLPLIAWYHPTVPDPALDNANAPPLMKADEEKLMFHRFNFSKKRLQELQKTAQRDGLTTELAQQLVEWRCRLEHYREYLVRTNLGLVLAMAKRSRLGHVDFAEVVSEGNLALLRAVDKFDADRGFKFSTYACRAILKAFYRASMQSARQHSRFPVGLSPKLEKGDWADRRRTIAAKDDEEESLGELRTIVDRNLAELTKVERMVIRLRFNWEEQEEAPLTLDEVGRIIGRSKERVRQIQKLALQKIRHIMEAGLPAQDSADC